MSLKIQENYPLKDLTTMQVGGPAKFYVAVSDVEELKEALDFARSNKLEMFVLSGGSNVVAADSGFNGLVININILGFEKIKEEGGNVWLRVGAGEVWDKVVERVVDHGWWGIENLSWIPGKMGACVVQNSGAYGQELGDVVDRVTIVEVESMEIKELEKSECGFGYRQSIFSGSDRGKYIISSVILKLSKHGQGNINYPDVHEYFKEKGIEGPGLKEIRDAVIYIRDNKLPNMERVGSAGSFFKNLVLSQEEFNTLSNNLEKNFGEERVGKVMELKDKFKIEGGIKIPTAWLIDICGLKGTQVGFVKVYEKQPLVLITELGKAKASEVMGLFSQVRRVVYEKTGMTIEPEPSLVGFSSDELNEYFKLD